MSTQAPRAAATDEASASPVAGVNSGSAGSSHRSLRLTCDRAAAKVERRAARLAAAKDSPGLTVAPADTADCDCCCGDPTGGAWIPRALLPPSMDRDAPTISDARADLDVAAAAPDHRAGGREGSLMVGFSPLCSCTAYSHSQPPPHASTPSPGRGGGGGGARAGVPPSFAAAAEARSCCDAGRGGGGGGAPTPLGNTAASPPSGPAAVTAAAALNARCDAGRGGGGGGTPAPLGDTLALADASSTGSDANPPVPWPAEAPSGGA